MSSLFEVAHRKKLGLFKIKDVYYAEKIRKHDTDYDVAYYFFCREDAKSSRAYTTTAVDLSVNEEDLLASFRKSTRKEIKHVINDENLKIETIEEPDEEQIKTFILQYNQFARKKGADLADNCRILTLHRAGRIALVDVKDQEKMVMQQIIIKDENKAVAFYGYTCRLEETDPVRIKRISSINKMVDYYCMLYWKKRNKKYYDFGGLLSDSDNPSGCSIDHYKNGFRGEVITEYEFVYPLTWKGKGYCWLKKQIHRDSS